MGLKMRIHKIKCIEDLEFEMPTAKGLYAITGMNGSGKSTIAACASSVFFNVQMNEYFGKTEPDSEISFELNDAKKWWYKENGKRWRKKSDNHVDIKGFYEGSLIFGNRFRDTSFNKVRRLEHVKTNELTQADNFIRVNLGEILQGDSSYYEKLFYLEQQDYFNGKIFFYEKNGKRISQFHMSTGENLLISILNSLLMRIQDRNEIDTPCMMILDEIELALHPSSLKRLTHFLEDMANKYNYAVYFSTHSLELISDIAPENIFYIDRHPDNTIEVINPCYPAYATRMLYVHSGYDMVILVEDDLAKLIIEELLRQEKLLNGKLVHVLPCGGYTKVIDLANDTVQSNLLGKITSVCIILDGDVQKSAEEYMKSRDIANNVPMSFLPIDSLEKHLRETLYVSVDQTFFRSLNDYLFHRRSLSEIIDEYSKKVKADEDGNGKRLYGMIEKELKEQRIYRNDLVKFTVDYLMNYRQEQMLQIINFLKKKLAN